MTDIKNEEIQTPDNTANAPAGASVNDGSKIKTRSGSGYLKQLYSTARNTAGSTHSHLKNLTTFLVNFVPVDKVDASELQVRVHFDDSEVQALAHSIKEHGVLQPILVVQDGDRYKVIAGERRLRASKLAGVERIPARVLSTNDKATHEIALRENLDRVDLHPLEEGEGYLSLLEAQLYTSHDSIAKAFGKPKSRITECIGFTRLPEETKAELLKHGIKNRSLLRQLLLIPVDQHSAKISDAIGQEEVLSSSQPGAAPTDAKAASSAAPKAKKEPKPFGYEFEDSRLSVPGFKWKAGEGIERLQGYFDAMKALCEKLEDRLTRP
jgi:ParB family chromosome partitioning protein